MSAVRHRAPTRARVIELYAAGWKPTQIRHVLASEGHSVPSPNTIWIWTHPKGASKQARQTREAARRWRAERASFAWPGIRSDDWKLARMAALRAAGVSYSNIARVMAIDFPKDPRLGDDQVRYMLQHGDIPARVPASALEAA